MATRVLLFGILFVTPAFFCDLVARERESQTFEILLTAPLSKRELLWGLISSRLAIILAACVACIPILSLSTLYCSLPMERMFYTLILLVSYFLFLTALSIHCSVVSSRMYIAIIRTYAILFLLWWLLPRLANLRAIAVVWPGAHDWIPILNPWNSQQLEQSNQVFKPIKYLFDRHEVNFYVANSTVARYGVEILTHSATCFAIIWILPAVTLFWRSTQLIRSENALIRTDRTHQIIRNLFRRCVHLVELIFGRLSQRNKVGQTPDCIRSEQEFARSPSRRDRFSSNPLIQRNLNSNVADPQRMITGAQFLIWIAFFTWATYCTYWSRDWFFRSDGKLLTMQWIFSAALALSAIVAASIISRELQTSSWDLLLLTELGARDLILGSLHAVLHCLFPTLLLLLLISIITGICHDDFWTFALWFAKSLAILTSVSLIGICNSILTGNARRSIIMTIGSLGMTCAALAFLEQRTFIFLAALGLASLLIVLCSRAQVRMKLQFLAILSPMMAVSAGQLVSEFHIHSPFVPTLKDHQCMNQLASVLLLAIVLALAASGKYCARIARWAAAAAVILIAFVQISSETLRWPLPDPQVKAGFVSITRTDRWRVENSTQFFNSSESIVVIPSPSVLRLSWLLGFQPTSHFRALMLEVDGRQYFFQSLVWLAVAGLLIGALSRWFDRIMDRRMTQQMPAS